MNRITHQPAKRSWIREWGPHRAYVVLATARCTDHSRRLKRCLASDTGVDPNQVCDEALALAEAAVDLAERCSEVDRWLRERDVLSDERQ